MTFLRCGCRGCFFWWGFSCLVVRRFIISAHIPSCEEQEQVAVLLLHLRAELLF